MQTDQSPKASDDRWVLVLVPAVLASLFCLVGVRLVGVRLLGVSLVGARLVGVVGFPFFFLTVWTSINLTKSTKFFFDSGKVFSRSFSTEFFPKTRQMKVAVLRISRSLLLFSFPNFIRSSTFICASGFFFPMLIVFNLLPEFRINVPLCLSISSSSQNELSRLEVCLF